VCQYSTAVVVYGIVVDVVVVVVGGEHASVAVAQPIRRVTRELAHCQQIVRSLTPNNKLVILDPEPVSYELPLQVNSQLVAVVLGQLV